MYIYAVEAASQRTAVANREEEVICCIYKHTYMELSVYLHLWVCMYISMYIYAVEAAAQRKAVAVKQKEVYKHIWSYVYVYVCLHISTCCRSCSSERCCG
jgi:hypothetical protein